MGKTRTSYKKGEGGRPKGIPNKTTRDIKEAYKQLIEKNLDNMTDWLEQIAANDPAKAIYIISELSEYVVPKLARTDLTSGDEPIKPSIYVVVDHNETAETLKRLRENGGTANQRVPENG